MDWILYALTGPALFGINNLIDKVTLQKYIEDVGAYTIIYGIASLLISILIFIVNGFTILNPFSAILMFLSGFFQVVIFLSYFKALTLDEASRVTPLFQFIPVFALIFAWLFLGESLKVVHLLGFAVIFVGGFALSGKSLTLSLFTPRPAFWYMMLASLGSASLGVLFKFVIGLNSFWQTIAWENLCIGSISLLLFLIPTYKKQFIRTVRHTPIEIYGLVVINEVIFFLGRLGLRYAFRLAPVALVTVLMGTQPIFVLAYTILLAKLAPYILKEDVSKKAIATKLVFMAIIVFGVYLVAK
ncbi:EamA family transporter [bacterium]|nr:EamA family transporter [bacterium]